MSTEAQNALNSVLDKAGGAGSTNLLPEQVRSWTLLQIDPDSPEYVVGAFEISGSLSIPVLQQSITATEGRVDILRSVFKDYLGVPLRVVRSTTRIALDVINADDESDAELEELLQTTARSEIGARFLPDQQPLMRAVLVTRRERNVLLVKASKLVADFRSIELWLSAVFESYQVLTEEKPAVGRSNRPFSHFVAHERAWATSAECAEQLRYWEQRLGTDTSFELPPDRVRPKVKTHSCAVVSRTLNEGQATALTALATENELPLERLVLAAFVAALATYTRRDEIVVGLTLDRRDAETEDLLGPLENQVALRSAFSSRVGLVETARSLDQSVREAWEQRRVSFQTIVDRVDPARDLARTPLFQCTFEAHDLRALIVNTRDIQVRRIAYPIGTSTVDFTMSLLRQPQGISLRVDFNTDLYRDPTLSTILNYVHELLAAAAAGADRSQAQAGAEVQAVPAPAAHLQYPLHELFQLRAAREPEAVVITHKDEVVTYQQLNERANRLAALLICKGVERDEPVAICLERSVDTVVAMLAVLKAGAGYLMLDIDHPAERRLYVLRDSGARVLISSSTVPFAPDQVNRINLDANVEVLAQLPKHNPYRQVHLDGLAYVLYTSGSTGAPKGVMVSHRSAANNIEWRARTWTVGAEDCVLLSQSFSFDPSVWAAFWSLSVGAKIVLLPAGQLDVAAILDLIDVKKITVFGGVPTLVSLLFEQANRGQCDSLRYVFCGGEVLPASLVGTIKDKSAAQLVNVYGPTETTIDVLYWECSDADREDPVPIGGPIADTRVYVLDENLLPVPTGFPGEICLSGTCLARGYWQRRALTAEKFMPDPYAPSSGARLYRTGDLGYRRPDGAIVFMGRVDEQVKVRGIRIELGEVELALCRHPSITETAVTLVKDEEFGERLVAYVVAPPDTTVKSGVVNQFLENLLPQCMVPSVYVQLPSLPRNSNGKVIRKSLPKPSAEAIRQSPQSPPQTPLQAEVQQEFVRALGIGDVGLYDDFFELGGTSVMLARLAPRLANRFSIDLPVQELFYTPTVAGVSATIETYRREGRKALAGRVHMEQLLRDCQFDLDVDLTLPHGEFETPREVLLTGATGYLGSFLLEQLLTRTSATIHCLLRANDTAHGLERLKASMTRYGLWNESFIERLAVVSGDLAKPQLGLDATRWSELAGSIDVIYHNGARVNFVYPYSKVREANVEGTKAILRLAATTRIKAVHHISTIDVLQTVMRRPLREVEPPDHAIDEVPAGYTGSKWAAECAVNAARKNGLPVAVYRPAQILGHTLTGATQTSDYLVIFVRGFLRMGILPVFPRIIDNVPVDYLAKAIVHISLKSASLGRFFNMFNPQPVSTATIYEWLASWGYEYEIVPYKEAQKIIPSIEPGHPLYPVLPLLLMEAPDPAPALDPAFMHEVDNSVECKNTLEMLADTDLVCPPVDEKYIKDSMQYLLNIGWLEPPDAMKRLLRRAQAAPRRIPTGNALEQAASLR